MSWEVPIGPLMPRSGYLASRSSTRSREISISSAMVANRLPSVVACAATLCERPAITVVSCSVASRAEPGEGGDGSAAQQLEGGADLELLDVLGQVAARHALVDVLVPGQRRELLDPGLHVVAGDALPRGDRVEVDLVDHVAVGLHDSVGYVDAEVALRLEHRDPEAAFEDDLVLGRPDRGQVVTGVPGGQHVGDRHG